MVMDKQDPLAATNVLSTCQIRFFFLARLSQFDIDLPGCQIKLYQKEEILLSSSEWVYCIFFLKKTWLIR